MKKLILILLNFLWILNGVPAQPSGWFWQNPLPQGNALYSIDFVSPTTGWAVGALGTILKTSAGGVTWQHQYSGENVLLRSVSFTDAEHGTAVGSGGLIVRTNDGGLSWAIQDSGTEADLSGVSFSDANNGTALEVRCGTHGPIKGKSASLPFYDVEKKRRTAKD